MADKSRSLYRGIMIPDGDISQIWEDESTIDQAGNRAGIPATVSDTETVIEAAGHQHDTGDGRSLDVLTSRGGYPGPGGSGFVWRQPLATSPNDQEYRGWDVPHQISAWENVDFRNNPGYNRHGDLITVTREDGTDYMLCAYDVAAAPVVSVFVRKREDLVWAGASAPSGSFQTYAAGYYCHPAVLVLPAGRVLVFYWIYDHPNNVAQLQMAYSDDEAATWTTGGEYTLIEPIDTTTIITKRIRAAYKDGQILIVAHVSDTTPPAAGNVNDRLIQFASDDLGATFTTITEFSGISQDHGGAAPDIGVVNETFLVVWVSTELSHRPRIARLGSAFDPINPLSPDITFPYSCASYDLPAGTAITEANLTIATDEDGAAYLFTTGFDLLVSTFLGASGLAARSFDGGSTWEAIGTGTGTSFGEYGRWWGASPPGQVDVNIQPIDYTAAFYRGQVVLVHRYRNENSAVIPTPGEDSLCFMYLGSYSTVTLPGIELFKRDTKRVGLPVTWLPFSIPSEDGTWAQIGAGPATTEAIVSPGRLHLAVAAGGAWRYSTTPNTGNGEDEVAYTDGFIGRFTYQNDPGSPGLQRVAIRVRASDSTYVQLNLDMSVVAGFTVNDPIAGVPLAQWLPGSLNKIQVFYAVRGTSDGGDPPVLGGECCVYARLWSPSEDRTWSLLYQGALANGGAATTSFIRWGDPEIITASDVYWYEFNACYGHTASLSPLTGEHFAQGQINPGDLFPRNFSPTPLYVDADTRIAAVDGPTFEGDLWAIDHRHLFTADNVLPTVTPSPAGLWRSKTASWGDIIAFERNPDLQDAYQANDLYAIHFQNINFKRCTIEVKIAGVWTLVENLNLFEEFSYVREGHTIRPTGVLSPSMYAFYNEFAGLKFEFNPDGLENNQTPTVIRNSEGVAYEGTTSKPSTLFLDPDSYNEIITPASGVGHLWWQDFTFLFDTAGLAFEGIRIKLCPFGTLPKEGYYEAGLISPGAVAVFGWDYSRERILTKTPNVDLTTLRDGTRHAYQAGGRRRSVRFSWAEGVDESQLRQEWTNPDAPDYVKTANSGTPVALRQDGPFLMYGLVDRLNGSAVPIVYLPKIDYLPGGGLDTKQGDGRQYNRGAIYGRMVTPVTLEGVVGDENTSEVFRVNAVTIEEEL